MVRTTKKVKIIPQASKGKRIRKSVAVTIISSEVNK